MPADDRRSDFGAHRPGPVAAALIRLAQGAPANAAGKQLAHALRGCALGLARLPLDVTVGEVRLRAHVGDNYSEKKFIFTPWRFDAREREHLRAALPPDGVFVDIGANVGIHSLLVATHLGDDGRILAFEPNPPAYERLRFNLEATRAGREHWPTVRTLPIGVSEADDEFELHVLPGDLGGSSLVPGGRDGAHAASEHAGGAAAHTVRVRCRPLLDVLDDEDITRIDALKIDIEGAEDAALVPFLEAADSDRLPRVIVMENSEDQWTRDLPGALERRGYTVAMRSRMNSVYALA